MTEHPGVDWQAVLFDFDGVIAASLEVKIRAFATLFDPWGEAVQAAVVRYHKDNGGMPRRDKLRHCCEAIVGQAVSDGELERLGQEFSRLVFDGVVAAPWVAGAGEALAELHRRRIPAFVVSGTPEAEMRLIVERRGLQPFFREVHGSPRPKPEIIADILARFRLQPECCLFVGDARADHQAAVATGLPFLGIVPTGAVSPFPAGVPVSPSVRLWL